MMIKTEGKDCHLLKLLHDGLVHHEADDEADAHHQEEEGADRVHKQVHCEVTHLWRRYCLDDLLPWLSDTDCERFLEKVFSQAVQLVFL